MAKMKWHSLVEKSMPQGTRRRRWYDLGITGLRTIANEGWRSFWWNFKEYNRKIVQRKVESSKIGVPKFEKIPEHSEECLLDISNFKKYEGKTFIQMSGVDMKADREEIGKKLEEIKGKILISIEDAEVEERRNKKAKRKGRCIVTNFLEELKQYKTRIKR